MGCELVQLALVNNMVVGVYYGDFTEANSGGVGYRAAMKEGQYCSSNSWFFSPSRARAWRY